MTRLGQRQKILAELARAREEESRRREGDAAEEATQNKVRCNTFMRARSGLRPRWQVRLEKREQQRLHREDAAKKEKAALKKNSKKGGPKDDEEHGLDGKVNLAEFERIMFASGISWLSRGQMKDRWDRML